MRHQKACPDLTFLKPSSGLKGPHIALVRLLWQRIIIVVINGKVVEKIFILLHTTCAYIAHEAIRGCMLSLHNSRHSYHGAKFPYSVLCSRGCSAIQQHITCFNHSLPKGLLLLFTVAISAAAVAVAGLHAPSIQTHCAQVMADDHKRAP